MLEIDLEEFVTTGTFGCLGRAPTREVVIETLGQPDSDGYPEHVQYGNVAFEFDAALKCIYRIMIAYPHSLNEQLNSCLNENAWPDSRFQFNPGRFQPGLKFRNVVNSLTGFEHAEVIGENPSRICVYTNHNQNIDLCFAPKQPLAGHTLYCIVSHL